MTNPTEEQLLGPSEVAARFGVATRTVARWARSGKLDAVLLPGGHRRYREADIRALLEGEQA